MKNPFAHLGLTTGRVALPDGSVSNFTANGDNLSIASQGDVTPAPSQTSDQQIISDKYGLGDLYKYAGGSYSQLTDWLSRTDVPEDRKAALVASLNGMITSLPEHSGLDLLSEQVIGRSNYQNNMQTLAGQIGTAISTAINSNYEEGYNSEVQQAARARAAGVNPDLSGVEPGKASDTNEQATPYSGLGGSEISTDFANVGISAFNMVVGFVSQVQGWLSNDITRAAQEVQFDDLLRDNITKSFATVANDRLSLEQATLKHAKSIFSGDEFAGSGLSDIATLSELEKWIDKYNKDNPNRKTSLSDLMGSAILTEAKNAPNPYTSVRARRAYDRAIRAISPNSPYVRSYINSLEEKASSAELGDMRNTIQIEEMLGTLGEAYRSGLTIMQEAENEINTFNQKYYAARNGNLPVTDSEGNVNYTDYVAAEASAEMEEIIASKQAAISAKYKNKLQSELRKTFDTHLESIEKKFGSDSMQYSIASILFPALMTFIEQNAIQSLGSMLSRPKPAPVNIQNTDNSTIYGPRTAINNNY